MKTVQKYLPEHQAFSTEEFLLTVSPEAAAGMDAIGMVEPNQNENVQELQPELFVTGEVEDRANLATNAK